MLSGASWCQVQRAPLGKGLNLQVILSQLIMPGSRVRVPPFPPTLFKDLHNTLPTLEGFSREFRVSLLSDSPPTSPHQPPVIDDRMCA